MKKINHIRAMTGILVVCFLFTSISSRCLDSPDFYGKENGHTFAKKTNAPLQSETLLFDEEEGEEKSERDFIGTGEYKFQGNLFPVCPPVAAVPLVLMRSLSCFFYPSHSLQNAAGIPLYLAHRTLQL